MATHTVLNYFYFASQNCLALKELIILLRKIEALPPPSKYTTATRMSIIRPSTENMFFTPHDVESIETSYKAKLSALRKADIVEQAVAHWYRVCMENRAEILQGLKDDIEKRDNIGDFTHSHKWSHAFTFLSFRSGRMDPHASMIGLDCSTSQFSSCGYTMSMWNIYRNTDFSMKLLKRLGLDNRKFGFKNLAYDESYTFVNWTENRIHLVYRN